MSSFLRRTFWDLGIVLERRARSTLQAFVANAKLAVDKLDYHQRRKMQIPAKE